MSKDKRRFRHSLGSIKLDLYVQMREIAKQTLYGNGFKAVIKELSGDNDDKKEIQVNEANITRIETMLRETLKKNM